ncbi:MAG: hypothetical protein VXX06_01805, partial [Pseudomonadota bacterium]|nr:hypothetical protein [Pseudomonadota bacterium]
TTDLGGFLDITMDFLVYSAIPFAFALKDPGNALAAAFLIFSFVGTGSSFLAYAIIAQKRGISTETRGKKSFFHLGGLGAAAGGGCTTRRLLTSARTCAMVTPPLPDASRPAKVGAAGSTRRRPVKPVEQPVEEQQHDGRDAPAKHHSTGRADPAAETGKRDLVRTDTRSGKPLPNRIKHPVNHRPQ